MILSLNVSFPVSEIKLSGEFKTASKISETKKKNPYIVKVYVMRTLYVPL